MSDTTTPEIVTYEAFLKDLNTGNVKSADLYSYGKIDLTYTDTEGVFRGVTKYSTASKDSLLTQTLETKEVQFTAHDTKYEGELDKGDGYMMWGACLIYLIPIALTVVIIIQNRTNATLSAKIAELSASNNK